MIAPAIVAPLATSIGSLGTFLRVTINEGIVVLRPPLRLALRLRDSSMFDRSLERTPLWALSNQAYLYAVTIYPTVRAISFTGPDDLPTCRCAKWFDVLGCPLTLVGGERVNDPSGA